MELFQKLLNKVQQGYQEADKRLGGFLPGGGTGNPLSNVARQVNPAEVAAFYGANTLNAVNKKVTKALQNSIVSAPEKLTMQQLPALMDAASKRMTAAGFPGVWSPFVSGRETGEVRNGRMGTKVDLSQGGFGQLIGGPAFANVNPLFGIDEPTVYATTKTPGWVIAHELGHAVDAVKRPYDYNPPKSFDFEDEASMRRFAGREMTRAASPGGLVTGGASLKNEDRSLLSAGIEGAIGGLGASQQILRKEIMADRFGMPIAKEAGVPWSNRQNALAKGTYVLGATTPGFAQGVFSELLGRGANAVSGLAGAAMRAFKGPELSTTEQALTKYGYDPSKYQMSMEGNQVNVKGRNKAEQALYNYITNLK